MTIYKNFKKTLKKCGSSSYICCNSKKYLFSEIYQAVELLSRNLNKQFHSGQVVGLSASNSIEFIVYLIALNKLGCVVHLKDIFESATMNNVDVYFSNLESNEKNTPLFSFKEIMSWKDASIPFVEEYEYEPENPTLIQESSGTTGVKKRCIRTAKNIEIDIENIIEKCNYSREETILCLVPFTHGYGLTMALLGALFSGAKLVCFSISDIKNLNQSNQHYTTLIGVPESYELLVENFNENLCLVLSNCKSLYSSSSRLPSELVENFYNLYQKKIYQVYGMMEVSTISIKTSDFDDSDFGEIIPSLKFKLGESGVLYLAGDTVSKNYVNSNGELSPALLKGWFSTGDIVSLDNRKVKSIERRS